MRLSAILILSFIFVGVTGSLFGAYSYYDQLSQMFEEEDFEIARDQLIQSSIINIIIMIIFVSLLGTIISKFVSRPLGELTQTVDEVTKGKLDVQLPKSRIYEIKNLTDSLNRILASLKLAIARTGAKGSELGLGEVIKAKESAEERYKVLSQTAFETIVVHDKGVLLEANDMLTEMFGYIPKELIGKQAIKKLVAPEKIKEMMEKIKSGSTESYRSIGIRKDGTRFPIEIKAKSVIYKGKKVRLEAIREIGNGAQSVKTSAKKVLKKTGATDDKLRKHVEKLHQDSIRKGLK